MPDYIKKARKLERRKEYLRAAEYYVLGGDHERAIELFEKKKLYLKAAKISERIGKADQAAEFYSRIGDFFHAAELLKKAGDTFQSALMYKRAKRYQDAAEMFEESGVVSEAARMLELEKDFAGAGERYLKAGMVRSAAICFEQAAQAGENAMDADDSGDQPDSETRELTIRAAEAWKLVPDIHHSAMLYERIGAWVEAGELYEQCGETRKALECYTTANEREKSSRLRARLNLPDTTGYSARQPEPEPEGDDYISLAQLADTREDFAMAAENYELAGEFALAGDRYEKICDYVLAAEMYFRADNIAKAAEMYELAGSHETAAKLYEQLEAFDKAISLYVKIKNFSRAARLYLDQGDHESALRILLRIPKDHPAMDSVDFLYGICYFRMGKIKDALKYAKKFLDEPISGENIELYYEHARALYEKEEFEPSLKLFRQVVDKDKAYKDSRQYLNWLAAMEAEKTADMHQIEVGELPIGMIINNRYELLELLGKGGMGVVYRAADRELSLAVALKVLHPKYSFDPDFIEMFKREVTLARMLAHPNVLKIYDLNRAGSLWFVSMEFLQGKELKTIIREQGALPVDVITSILTGILKGLAHSHKSNLLHCDIKPQNIFIDSRNSVTIVDFGIARAVGSISDDDMITGTPEYIAPEQIHGDPATVQSDLYSLGVTLYEMATGRMAFHADTIEAVLDQQLEMYPEPPRSVRPELPEWLEKIILKLMDKEPENRFQSAGEVLQAIPSVDSPD